MIVEKLSPEALISAPRRGPAIPNNDGTLALYTESIHVDGKTRNEFYLLDIRTGVPSSILHDDQAYDPSWLADGTNTIVYLRSGGMGLTFVLTIDVDCSPLEPSIVGHIRAPVYGLKTQALGDGTLAFTVLGHVGEDGGLLNTDGRKHHGGRVYSSSRLQLQDLQKEPYASTVWCSTLSKQDGTWRIAGGLYNALGANNLRVPQEPSQYDLCENGIVVAANTGSDAASVYFIRVHSFGAGTLEVPIKIEVQSEEYQGISTSPQFSPNGSMIAFLRKEGLDRDRSQIYVYHTSDSKSPIGVFDMVTGKPWPLVSTSFRFSPDGHSIYIAAEDHGQVGLYHLNLQPNAYPQCLLQNGVVSAFYPLGRSDSGKVLVTSSSFVDNCLYQIVSLDLTMEPVVLSPVSNNGIKLGLSQNQVSEIYFEGGGDYIIHAWMVKPRHFDESRKFPLAILVHDNVPTTTWLNTWNTEWNAAAWAEQGYVVVLPNITGSTGYGQGFATAIHDHWSGQSYDDLVSCLYSLRNVPGVDVDNAVIAGAGYGGYLMNWIQGHPLATRFKAMVCHAGIFNTQSMAPQANPLEFNRRIGGLPLFQGSSEILMRYNPARPDLLRNWKTPMLVIHNERDPVAPISEGLAAYNNLQSLGVPSKFMTFADEGHDVAKEDNSIEWHREVFSWLNGFTSITAQDNTTVA
ncbi:prolyl oligopeptidase [Nemania serpens]|nr:prolyl oligopeptidase [Nemania serpens]